MQQNFKRAVDEFCWLPEKKAVSEWWEKKVMVFKIKEIEVFDFSVPYTVNGPAVEG